MANDSLKLRLPVDTEARNKFGVAKREDMQMCIVGGRGGSRNIVRNHYP